MGASKSELWTQVRYLVKILDELYKFCATNTTNYNAVEELLQEAYVGTHVGATQQQLSNVRNSLSAVMKNGTGLLQAALIELAKNGYNSTATTVNQAIDDIYDGMQAVPETVKERDYTFAAISAWGSNNGNGTVLRVTKDKNAHDLESGCFPGGTIKIRVTKDFAQGRTSGNEEALIYGSGEVKTDELTVGTAPAEIKTLAAQAATNGLLTNGDFETQGGTAPAITLTGWTMSNVTKLDTSATVYRGSKSLKFTDNCNILQYLASVTIDPTRPVMAIVHFNRSADACDGTLTLRLGTKTEAVTLAAQSGWTTLILGTTTPADVWYDNFKEDYSGAGIRAQLTLASRTGGSLLVDEFIVIQPSLYDGKYWLLKAGSTDFLKEDYWTFADTVANTGRIQTWLARLFGKHWPHTSGTPTYADL